jgi:hypothetical protein
VFADGRKLAQEPLGLAEKQRISGLVQRGLHRYSINFKIADMESRQALIVRPSLHLVNGHLRMAVWCVATSHSVVITVSLAATVTFLLNHRAGELLNLRIDVLEEILTRDAQPQTTNAAQHLFAVVR